MVSVPSFKLSEVWLAAIVGNKETEKTRDVTIVFRF